MKDRPGPARILCIDDSADQRFMLERILTSEGYRTVAASSGREGIEKARASKPDLVFLDLMMPGMDGFETCALLQKERAAFNVPVVILTASRSEEDRRRAFMVGAADFLSKPAARKTVLDKVEQHIAGRTRWLDLDKPRSKPQRNLSQFRQFLSFAAGHAGLSPAKREEIERSSPARYQADFESMGVGGRKLAAMLGEFLGYGAVEDLSGMEPRIGVLPTAFCKANLVLPATDPDSREVVVVANPFDQSAMDTLSGLPDSSGHAVLVCDPAAMRVFFARLLGEKAEAADPAMDIEKLVSEFGAEEAESTPVPEDEGEVSEDDGHVVKLVHGIIADAWKKRASDIHVEPSPDAGVQVRYRIDGALRKALSFPRQWRTAVPSRIKIMAGLDIAERRRPQSGKISFRKWGGPDVELRVETIPTSSGAEDVVLRILSSSKPLPLSALGMAPANLAAFTAMIERPHGIVLCVGPTGSGKTTTLHSALAHINRPEVKIVTAEDPVEITQKGLRQVQVNPKAGFTFASAMRSFLRADPDVIMIGEMRDVETCQTAIEASLTGHLVLSTLHTNSAPETVGRLLNIGMDRFSLGDALRGVLAQRLVRKLCQDCMVRAPLSDAEAEKLRVMHGADEEFEALAASREAGSWSQSPAGCESCAGSGTKGRAAVHELLVADDGLRELVYAGAHAAQLKAYALERGMKTLAQDAVAKALSGVTTINEILAACGA